MKAIAAAILLSASLFISSCGSNSTTTGNINGTWDATLSSTTGGVTTENFAFATNLTVNSDSSLGTSNFNISVNNTSCTFPATTETGSFTFSGNFNGQVSGTFNYVVTSTGDTVNTLTLNGMVSGGQITGTWTVSGASSGCTGNGTFTMTPAA